MLTPKKNYLYHINNTQSTTTQDSLNKYGLIEFSKFKHENHDFNLNYSLDKGDTLTTIGLDDRNSLFSNVGP